MSIWSWNCRGAGSTETVQRLRGIRKRFFPDLLFLSETMQQSKYMESLKVELGYDEMVTVDPVGRSGGLALMWKSSYSVEILSQSKRIIDTKVKIGSLVFYVSCVYGDPVREHRKRVWEQLTDMGMARNDPWLLLGDFNELMSNNEKLGGTVRAESTFWDFRNFAANCKLRELRTSGNTLSWAGWRDKVWVQCRLDRSFGNDEWFRLFPRSQTEYRDMRTSDHRPIRVDFIYEPDDRGKGRFYFDQRMLNKAGIEKIVEKGWNARSQDGNTSLTDRINSCRSALARWKKAQNMNSQSNIESLTKLFEAEVAKQFPNHRTMTRLKSELAEAHNQEELFWRQKSREQWLREGDRNTSFFHNSVKGRIIRNKVLMLKNDRGEELFSEGAKGNLAAEYFRELFMSTNPYEMEALFEGFERKVTPEMNNRLTQPVTLDEIKHAAFSIKGSSAPDEDGLTGAFYQRFWHIVGPSITEEIQNFFSFAVIPEGWNHTQLCLLPKIPNPSMMKDMRPISLCSVQYKIISKILCQRLKPILPSLVSDTQGAFVSERLISDNIIVAHEMIHGLRTNESIGKQYMAIKTDMSKAYDRVEWSFLEILLENMGFDHKWTRWVMSCVTTVSYTILLNGQTHGLIKPERGIRQGDPLSPFLFILCAEALVHVLNMAEKNGNLHGIKLSKNGPAVHHLLFADDSLLMCKANEEESLMIMTCLKKYGDASGQEINKMKSSIIFGGKIPEDRKAEIKRILEIDKEGGDGTYLGLPECFQGSKQELLNFIRERLQGRLQGWFLKALSQGGKEILLKSIALALPVYAMSVFKLPKDLCDKLTSAMVEFWWSNGSNKKKIAWVAWQRLCKRKDEGGLGFHDISSFNQSLLAKQAWRILQRPNSLVARVLKSKYWRNSSFLECGEGTRPSYAWRSILHGRELLAKGLVKRIGYGESTRVWTENWIQNPLPRAPIYREDCVVDLTLCVSDLLIPNTSLWDVHQVRQLFIDEDAASILSIKPMRIKEDRLVWGFTREGTYSSQSGYKLIDTLRNMHTPGNGSLPPIEKRLWNNIWKLHTSPKIRHFVWRALAGALAVAERLRSRGIPVDVTCKACGASQETICHSLFICPAANDTWSAAGLPLPERGFSPNSVFLNIHHLIACTKSAKCSLQLQRCIPWVLWHIWKARNALVFEKIRIEPASSLRKAEEESEIWFNLNYPTASTPNLNTPRCPISLKWEAPADGILKCNIAASWSESSGMSGASWVVRNSRGQVLKHSRRSYSQVRSRELSELWAIYWAIESMSSLHMKKVIFESSCELARACVLSQSLDMGIVALVGKIGDMIQRLQYWSLDHVVKTRNELAQRIANSVTAERRFQSYVAAGGPSWLNDLIMSEARNVSSLP